MRTQEQEKIQNLLVKYSRDDDIYKLLDLTALMYRTTSNKEIEFYDFLRIMLADTANGKGGIKNG